MSGKGFFQKQRYWRIHGHIRKLVIQKKTQGLSPPGKDRK